MSNECARFVRNTVADCGVVKGLGVPRFRVGDADIQRLRDRDASLLPGILA